MPCFNNLPGGPPGGLLFYYNFAGDKLHTSLLSSTSDKSVKGLNKKDEKLKTGRIYVI